MSSIHGVVLHPLESHDDARGSLTEIHRREWGLDFEPVQWNLLRSSAGTVRGVHCHVHHWDLLVVADGELVLGLIDLRPGSPTEGRSELHRVPAASVAVVLPPGVAHGFLFERPTTMVYGVSHYWSTEDELGCRWDDPALGIEWPIRDAELSPRDRDAGSLADLQAVVAAALVPDRP